METPRKIEQGNHLIDTLVGQGSHVRFYDTVVVFIRKYVNVFDTLVDKGINGFGTETLIIIRGWKQ